MFKRVALFLLILWLPFQLGYHFWLPDSFVKSFRIDYLSPTIYVQDILIFIYLVSSLFTPKKNSLNIDYKKISAPLFLLCLLNILASEISQITAIAWIRLLMSIFLLKTLIEEESLKRVLALPFQIGLVVVCATAILQITHQGSLNGIFRLLGERQMTVATPNVARAVFFDQSFIRPYSTFSHPNSLAGYLLISLVLLKTIDYSRLIRILVIFTIILTTSKSAIIALFVLLLNPPLLITLITSIGIVIINLTGSSNTLPQFIQLSLIPRKHLIDLSLEIIKLKPLLGTGLTQFIPNLSNLIPQNQLSYSNLQPVHNIFLLLLSEIGLVGYLLCSKILLICKKIQIRDHKLAKRLLIVVLVTGVLDHYWLTLVQNQLILIFAISLVYNNANGKQSPNNKHRRRI